MAALTKEALLLAIQQCVRISDTSIFAEEHGWEHDTLVSFLQSFEVHGLVTNELIKRVQWVLTIEGQGYKENGSPEAGVFKFIKAKEPVSNEDITATFGEVGKIGVAAAMKNKWIKVEPGTKAFLSAVDSITDTVKEELGSLDTLDKKQLDALKKRKLIEMKNMTSLRVEQTDRFTLDLSEAVQLTEITQDMLQKKTWTGRDFKPFNFFNVSGVAPKGGHLHPFLKMRGEIRTVLLNMGFQEMASNQWVESSFWNFDSLFQPQQHPARDAHDTFFIADPKYAQDLPTEYLEAVKQMHESGGGGSTGWKYDWSETESRKNILRTHTTSVSARTLYKMAQEYKQTGVFTPKKYFSIDRVFRNETLDATHLAEFHQVEGFVADRNLGLGHLIGVIREFFRRIGIEKLHFKPAYNPYTEPSMEIFGKHPVSGKWMEVGNSGCFRPEMLLPMGLPEDVTVIAWGIGLERHASLKYAVANIRELFGAKQDLLSTAKQPICWLKPV